MIVKYFRGALLLFCLFYPVFLNVACGTINKDVFLYKLLILPFRESQNIQNVQKII